MQSGWRAAILCASAGAALTLLGCATNGCEHDSGFQPPATTPLYIIRHGWHTSIALETNAPGAAWLSQFPELKTNRFMEFAWGEERYYISTNETMWMAARATLTPCSSVLHVAGFDSPPEQFFTDHDVVCLWATEAMVTQLCVLLENEFAAGMNGRPHRICKGFHGDSGFYKGRYLYHGLNTCNTWTARMLRDSGWDVSAFGAMRAPTVMRRVEPLGEVLRRRAGE